MDEVIRENHNIIVEDRKKLTLTGVKDVISFDEETVVLDTALGRLTVKGAGLHIGSLATEGGDMTLSGRLFALAYTETEKGGFMSRLFG